MSWRRGWACLAYALGGCASQSGQGPPVTACVGETPTPPEVCYEEPITVAIEGTPAALGTGAIGGTAAPDIIYKLGGKLAVAIGQPGGHFIAGPASEVAQGPMAVGDLDGDGVADVAVQDAVHFLGARGEVAESVPLPEAVHAVAVGEAQVLGVAGQEVVRTGVTGRTLAQGGPIPYVGAPATAIAAECGILIGQPGRLQRLEPESAAFPLPADPVAISAHGCRAAAIDGTRLWLESDGELDEHALGAADHLAVAGDTTFVGGESVTVLVTDAPVGRIEVVPTAMATADFNADGLPDLVVGQADELLVYLSIPP